MYLLDTNVISALRRREKNIVVAHWVATLAPDDLHVSVATITEIEQGIERQKNRDPVYAGRLTAWLDRTIEQYGERILPITTSIARRWAQITAAMGHNDFDFAIAATALEQDLTVVTRNVRDFVPTGVTIFDPFEGRTYKPE